MDQSPLSTDVTVDQADDLISALKRFYPGQWEVCDHGCRSIEHGHAHRTCVPPEPKPNQDHDTESRGVDNSCVHYRDIRATKEIRTIRICQSDDFSPLRLIVDTVNTPFRETTFVAVSHCWGDLHDVEELTLCHILHYPDNEQGTAGICFPHPFNVTKRLHRALRCFRTEQKSMPTEMCRWWIDAICINQNNLLERGQQVSIMGQIYSAATFVAVWLDLDPLLTMATDLVLTQMVGTLKNKHGEAYQQFYSLEQIETLKQEPLVGNSSTTRTLDLLYNNPWFTRIWVLQEIFMANANAIVYNDLRRKFFFSEILLGYRYWARVEGTFASTELWGLTALRLGHPAHRVRMATQGEVSITPKRLEPEEAPFHRAPILETFSRSIGFAATNPRDKLFGTLALAEETCIPDSIPEELRPSYTKSVSQVYIEFTRFCLVKYRNLEFLQCVAKSARLRIVGAYCPLLPKPYDYPPLDHPSWALWHAPQHWWLIHDEQHLKNFSIRDDLPFDANKLTESLDKGQLPLNGVKLDEVESILPYVFKDFTEGTVFYTSVRPLREIKKRLHSVWDELLAKYEARFSTPTPERNFKLWETFIKTIQCPRRSVERPFTDYEAMRNFACFWIFTYPDEQVRELCKRYPSEPVPFGRLKYTSRIPDVVKTKGQDVFIEAATKMANDGVTDQAAMMRELKEYAHKFATSLHHLRGRCIFVTKKGNVGLGPYGMREGDALVSLGGAKFVSVLRAEGVAVEGSVLGKGWTFVGDAFVHAWLGGNFVEHVLEGRGGKEDHYVLI